MGVFDWRVPRANRRAPLRRWCVVLGVGLAWLVVSVPVRALPVASVAESPSPRANIAAKGVVAEAPVRTSGVLGWPAAWRRADHLDAALSISSFGVAFSLLATTEPRHGSWKGPILFDALARDVLSAGDRKGRQRASAFGDVFAAASSAFLALDAAMISLRDADLGWQVFILDAEAYGVSLLMNTMVKLAVGRARPYAAECRRDPNYDVHCSSKERYVSFYSQHSSLSATVAGLTCAVHTRLPVYGRGGDMAACLSAIGMSAAVGVSRIASDNHWASDIVTGHLIGFSVGFFLPWALHFRAQPSETGSFGPRVTGFGPRLGGENRGFALSGTF
jgi:membrane-associated phospholipid phosphatase